MIKLRSPRPSLKTCVLSSSLALGAAACSSDGSDQPVTTPPPQSSAAPTAMPETTPEQPSEGEPETPSTGGTTEIPTGDIDLSQPQAEGDDPAAEPGDTPPVADGAPVESDGCGSTEDVASGRFTVDVAGNSRDYILALPEDYDPARPYPLVFTWHPGGGTAQGTANNYYGLRQLADDTAIFVSPEGIDNGWANTQGRDIAFLDAMLDRFQNELCIDQSRIFSTGFSYGGMMSFAVACARADVFRAIAPMAGALYSGCADGDSPIAMLAFHGTTDTVVPIANGVSARNEIASRNGCEPADRVPGGDGCITFEGCSEGHPTTWCEFNGGHQPAPQAAGPIWDFFEQF
jgi:polyhydroxybutyrate depolymerase